MADNSEIYKDPDWLREKYWEEGLGTKEIGEVADVSAGTILRWMRKHDIERRPPGGDTGSSREDVIDALQKVADRLGKSPTLTEYKQVAHDNEPSVGAYKQFFDSWNNTKKEAGLSQSSPGPDGPSNKECIHALQKVANRIGKSPSQREYNEAISDEGIPAANIKHQFGSWNAAKSAAGLQINEKHGWTKPDVIDSLCEVSERYEGRLSKRAYAEQRRSTDPSVETVMRLFGSWNDALKEAGLAIQNDHYTEEDCIEALQYVSDKLDRSPRKREYHKHRRDADPSPWVIKNTFESWNEMKELAGLHTYNDGSYLGYPYGPNWDQVAERIRERDNNQCTVCEMKGDKHTEIYNCDLEVHHFHKLMSFYDQLPGEIREKIRSRDSKSEVVRYAVKQITKLANDPTNLITVCKECHCELERLPIEQQVRKTGSKLPKVQPSDVSKVSIKAK